MLIKVGAQAHIAINIAYDEVTSVGELLSEVFIPGNHLGAQAHNQQQWFSVWFTDSLKFYSKAIGVYFRHWTDALSGVCRATIAGDGFSDDVSACTGAKKNGEPRDVFRCSDAPPRVAFGDGAPIDICVATAANACAQHPGGKGPRSDSVADDVFFGQVQCKASSQVMHSCFR